MNEALPPNERCARCGGEFRCGMSDDRPCACTSLVLLPQLLARLQQEFTGCLCLACLRQLQEEVTP